MARRRSEAQLFRTLPRAGFAVLLPVVLWQSAASAEGDGDRFDILEYVVSGNTVLPQIEVEKTVYAFLGPDRSMADAEKARDALEAVYRKRGFQTVQILLSPKIVKGVATLQVLEAPVGRLRVVGARYYLPSEIKAEAPSLAEGTVPDFNRVQNDIVALNQWPDRKVTPTLKAGKDPGTVDVDLQVEDQVPLHASAELNNQQSVGTTALRTLGTVSYDNLWQLGHSISASYQVSPQDVGGVRVFSGSYLWRFAGSPWSVMLDGLTSNSNVATVGGTDVLGRGSQVGLHALLALPGDEGFAHSLTATVYYKHFQDTTALGAESTTSPVTYYPVNVSYAATLQEEDAVTDGTLGLTFAAQPLGSAASKFDALREDARGQNFYVKAEFGRLQHLPWDIDVALRVQGQLADQPLISNEQFAIGGYGSVRGYFEAEDVGDDGVRSSLEVRSPSIAPWLNKQVGSVFDDLHGLLFADTAGVWLIDALPEQQSRFVMASAGAGLSGRMLTHVNASAVMATPFLSSAHTHAGSEKFLFRLWAEY